MLCLFLYQQQACRDTFRAVAVVIWRTVGDRCLWKPCDTHGWKGELAQSPLPLLTLLWAECGFLGVPRSLLDLPWAWQIRSLW